MMKHRFMDLPQVLNVTRTSRSRLYAMVAKNEFPQPIKIGLRSSRWLESEVNAWMETRIAKARGIQSSNMEGVEQ